MKINAMIPARMGSERIKHKNLRLLSGKPLPYYAIKACQESNIFDNIILNSESDILGQVATRYGAEYYKRPDAYATSQTKSDEVVYDFIKNNPCDIVFWVNPTSPLQRPEELEQGLKYFIKNDLDSLFTTERKKIHSLYNEAPLNFDPNGLFPRTQDLPPVDIFVFSYMAWKAESFVKSFEEHGHAFLCGKTGYFPVSQLSAIDIDYEDDFQLAEFVINAQKLDESRPQFDELYFENNIGQ